MRKRILTITMTIFLSVSMLFTIQAGPVELLAREGASPISDEGLLLRNGNTSSMLPSDISDYNGVSMIEERSAVEGKTEYNGIPVATGSSITREDLLKEDNVVSILDYGAAAGGNAVTNTNAINEAIKELSQSGGGTVVVPAGEYKMYTIELQSNVNIYLDKDAIIYAALPGVDGGNFLEPEVNRYVGLQDHGHSYFADSLIYGADIENVMIYGEGTFAGSFINKETGLRHIVLSGRDSATPEYRTERGYKGSWNPPDDLDQVGPNGYFYEGGAGLNTANKGISLVRTENVILADFDMLNCGHFAIITEGADNVLIENLLIDTNRDGIDIDCTQNCTIRNCTINALQDDAIVLKASYGAGIFMPTANVLVHDCIVSGYDAGSIFAGTFSTDRIVANTTNGPTGRFKLGTEATCGFDQVTAYNILFCRSEGICLESVDGSPLTNIIVDNCYMKNVSSSPIFLRLGDRARYPITGNSTEELVNAVNNVRLDNPEWVLPNTKDYTKYPAQRYVPAYNKEAFTLPDGTKVNIVDHENPLKINTANFAEIDGKYYEYKWNEKTENYEVNFEAPIAEEDLGKYGNAIATGLASSANISISNITAKDVDPRYPLQITGMVDSKVQNIILSDISVEFRGGLSMEDATNQRRISTDWTYAEYMAAPLTQELLWMANGRTNESLIPRYSWNTESDTWTADPFNVPEVIREYPEPVDLGILPAYGLYIRHADGVKINNLSLSYLIEDTRIPIVFDDVQNAELVNVSVEKAENLPDVVEVNNNFKRPASFEWVPEEPYIQTKSSGNNYDNLSVETVTVEAPEPGTPSDSLYPYPTNPMADEDFMESINSDTNLPGIVYRPYFVGLSDIEAKTGDILSFKLETRNPAESNGKEIPLTFSAENMPEGAVLEGSTFTWTPTETGEFEVTFILDDGILPVRKAITIIVS